MSRQQILERERRQRPWVIAACFVPFALYFGGILIESSSSIDRSGLDTEFLRTVDENSGPLIAATVVRSLGFAFMAVPLVYLFQAIQRRTDRVQGLFLGLVVLGPVLMATQGLVGAIAERDVAADFVAQSAGVGDIYSLAENLRDESGGLQTAAGLLLPSLLALVFAMIYVPLWGVRVGLLPRFFGTFGMALGASVVFLGGIALFAIAAWFVYLGLLLLGRVPAGRPPAWDAGEAIPWPTPGQAPAEPAAVAAGNGGVVEGDASEIPGVEESPHAARRERAKRRKRKRRQ